MDLVRIQEDRLYDREAILGRDTASVFPAQSQQAASANAENAKAALGAMKFVSEKQLEELRAQRGERVEDGAVAPDKPLVQVLAEAKEAKEEKFKAVWHSMKQGKNRPLDDDELEFVNDMLDRERKNDSRQAQEESQELEAYRQAVQAANERSTPAGPLGPQLPRGQDNRAPGQSATAQRPRFVQISRVKQPSHPPGDGAVNAPEPPAKRLKPEQQAPGLVQQSRLDAAPGQTDAGLDGMFSGYGSSSDEGG